MVHRSAGLDPRFRVAEAPLDLRFAPVCQHKVRHFRTDFAISPPMAVCRTTAIEEVVPASLFEMTEPPVEPILSIFIIKTQ